MNKFKHLMIDLETMGNKPGAAIVAIAAVPFDMVSGVTDDALFYEVVDLQSSVQHGGKIDADTVLWWLGKSDNARNEITNKDKAIQLTTALANLNGFASLCCEENVRVWGNGVCFDNVILRGAYENCSIPRSGSTGGIGMCAPLSSLAVMPVSTRKKISRLLVRHTMHWMMHCTR